MGDAGTADLGVFVGEYWVAAGDKGSFFEGEVDNGARFEGEVFGVDMAEPSGVFS